MICISKSSYAKPCPKVLCSFGMHERSRNPCGSQVLVAGPGHGVGVVDPSACACFAEHYNGSLLSGNKGIYEAGRRANPVRQQFTLPTAENLDAGAGRATLGESGSAAGLRGLGGWRGMDCHWRFVVF